MSDEFDDFPDDFTNVDDVNWDQILSAPPPPLSADPSQDLLGHEATSVIPVRSPDADSSTHYSCDDEDLDPSFLEELDNLEKYAVQFQPGPSAVAEHSTRIPGDSTLKQGNGSNFHPEIQPTILVDYPRPVLENARQAQVLTSVSSPSLELSKENDNPNESPSRLCSLKRAREASPLKTSNKKGKGKAGENEGVWQVLSGFEDELTCPICSDIFIAAHLCNPCGHSVCGDCGWQWKSKGKTNCAICRTELARDMPMIPNFAMDNTVEKHVTALGQSGLVEWNLGGTKYTEWLSRKEQWKRGVADRAKAKISEKRLNRTVLVWEILSDDELDGDINDLDANALVGRHRRVVEGL